MWTHERYHKDVATEVFTYETQVKMWNYNAKDVYTLKLIKDAQTEYCNKPTIHPSTRGLNESIAQANSAIIPYLRAQNVGMKLDRILQLETESQLALAKEQYIRIIRKLINIKDFNPASTKQCSKFFHDTLHYPVVKRGESGTPTLGRKQLYQLMLKHDNPCIPIIIKARKVAKDLSMLESELMTLI
jgi:DNA polymerase I-like protein with 3'-5' exonuclease and polymerase domains